MLMMTLNAPGLGHALETASVPTLLDEPAAIAAGTTFHGPWVALGDVHRAVMDAIERDRAGLVLHRRGRP